MYDPCEFETFWTGAAGALMVLSAILLFLLLVAISAARSWKRQCLAARCEQKTAVQRVRDEIMSRARRAGGAEK